MRERWPKISDKTTVEMVRSRRIDVPIFKCAPKLSLMLETSPENVGEYWSYFETKQLELTLVGDYLCYYQQDSDTLFVQNVRGKMDSPETIKDALYLPDAGAFSSGETIEDGQFSGATASEVRDQEFEPSLVRKSENDFHIGPKCDSTYASKLVCVLCGGSHFFVGSALWYTAISCIDCGWELCVHSG